MPFGIENDSTFLVYPMGIATRDKVPLRWRHTASAREEVGPIGSKTAGGVE